MHKTQTIDDVPGFRKFCSDYALPKNLTEIEPRGALGATGKEENEIWAVTLKLPFSPLFSEKMTSVAPVVCFKFGH